MAVCLLHSNVSAISLITRVHADNNIVLCNIYIYIHQVLICAIPNLSVARNKRRGLHGGGALTIFYDICIYAYKDCTQYAYSISIGTGTKGCCTC